MNTITRIALAVATATAALVATTSSASAAEPAGTAFGRSCAMVTILVVPGTHETTESAGMDVAKGVLGDVVAAIGPYGPSIQVHYLGYPATLVPYGASRAHGYEAAWSTVDYYARQCPTSMFVLTGYSQGAHIAGDLAATIGKAGSPVAPERVRSVRLLADPVRDVDTPVVGTGGSMGGILGGRGDFGALDDRVTEYCDARDMICNDSLGAEAASLSSWFGPHTSYQESTVPTTGATYVQQMADDLVQDVVNLNRVTF